MMKLVMSAVVASLLCASPAAAQMSGGGMTAYNETVTITEKAGYWWWHDVAGTDKRQVLTVKAAVTGFANCPYTATVQIWNNVDLVWENWASAPATTNLYGLGTARLELHNYDLQPPFSPALPANLPTCVNGWWIRVRLFNPDGQLVAIDCTDGYWVAPEQTQ